VAINGVRPKYALKIKQYHIFDSDN